GLYHRTPPDVLELWRERFAVQHLKEPDLISHFEACESALSVQLNPGRQPAASIKMKIGAERLGWKTIEVPRWFKYSQMRAPNNVARGIRQSMTETFVPAAQAAGCRIVPGVRAEKLERAGMHWQVGAVRQGGALTIGAEAGFVWCGGLETTALPRRSRMTKKNRKS